MDLIFATEIGTPIMQRNILRRHLAPILTRAELPASIHMYTLRHSCASLLHSSGEKVKTISERLGHYSTAFTLDVYVHSDDEAQEIATARMEKTLFG